MPPGIPPAPAQSGRRRIRDRNRNGVPDNLESGPTSPRGGTPGNAPGGGNTLSSPRRDRPRNSRGQPSGGGNTGNAPGADTNVPTSPLMGTTNSVPNTPFGQQYNNLNKMGSDLFNNPDVLASGYLNSLGIDPMHAGGMNKVYSDFAQTLPQLWLLTQGMGSMAGGAGIPDFSNFIDYAGQALGAGGTPGAGVLSPSVVGQGIFGAPQDSAVYGFLNDPNADPESQVSALLGLLGGGLQGSLPAPVLSALMGQAQNAGNQYINQLAQQGTPTGQNFSDFLAQLTNIDEMLGFKR